MAASNLPFEVKRLIYDHADLATIKSLRLVSQDWATTGVELLFLPSFVIKSSVKDLSRLINIGSRQKTARQAARIIRTINFWSNDWDPLYLRSIVCSRHVHLTNYEVLHFVPTVEEQKALEELDGLIQQRTIDKNQGESMETLTEAFKQVPNLQTLHITCPNAFKHPILRKVWDEYNLETYRKPYRDAGPLRFRNILSAANEAGLNITKVRHEQFNDNFFITQWDTVNHWNWSILNKNLRSLSLDVNGIHESLNGSRFAFQTEDDTGHEDITSTSVPEMMPLLPHTLEYFAFRWESLHPFTLDIVATSATNLHTLSLIGIKISPYAFLPFITSHVPKLRQLQLGNAELGLKLLSYEIDYDWEMILTILRDTFGNSKQLEKFQLSGVIKSAYGRNTAGVSSLGGPTWMLWPIYRTTDEEWQDLPWSHKRSRTKEIERFVVEQGEWPMVAADDVSDFVT
ncbi:uncharacterized protein RAG0_10350 [Rhynchosporium agropyri]|uniref:F-box domain-containing protein n=1 Tax=Rhynchosporium agropyri TaxID=914238 RepID=A0A1E1KZH0_9HELO|nr:uncharacterized protein RAG0_10350 [Rhynchosporium agropyri]